MKPFQPPQLRLGYGMSSPLIENQTHKSAQAPTTALATALPKVTAVECSLTSFHSLVSLGERRFGTSLILSQEICVEMHTGEERRSSSTEIMNTKKEVKQGNH